MERSKKKKRTRNESSYAQNIRKIKRNSGEEHTTKKSKRMSAKILQNKNCICPKKYFDRVEYNERKSNFDHFWNLEEFKTQNIHLRTTVDKVLHLRTTVDKVLHLRTAVDKVLHLRTTVDKVLHLRTTVHKVLHLRATVHKGLIKQRRTRTSERPMKKCSYKYFPSQSNQLEVSVCRKFYLDTFKISVGSRTKIRALNEKKKRI